MENILCELEQNSFANVSYSPNSDYLYKNIPYFLIQNNLNPVFIIVKDYDSLRRKIPRKCKIIRNIYDNVDKLDDSDVLIIPNYDLYNIEVNAVIDTLINNNLTKVIINTFVDSNLRNIKPVFTRRKLFSLIEDSDDDVVIYVSYLENHQHIINRIKDIGIYNVYINSKIQNKSKNKNLKNVYFINDGMEYVVDNVNNITVIDTLENDKVLIENPDTFYNRTRLLYRQILSRFGNGKFIVLGSSNLYNAIPKVNYWCKNSLASAFLNIRNVSNLIPYFSRNIDIINKYNSYITIYDVEHIDKNILKLPIGIESQILLNYQMSNEFIIYPTIVFISFLASSIEYLSIDKEKHYEYLTNSDLKSYLSLWTGFIEKFNILRIMNKQARSNIDSWSQELGLNNNIFRNICLMIIKFTETLGAIPYHFNIENSVKNIMEYVPNIFSRSTNLNGFYSGMKIHYNILSNMYERQLKNIFILKISNGYIVSVATPVSKRNESDLLYNRALRLTLRDIEENIIDTDQIFRGNLNITEDVYYEHSTNFAEGNELFINQEYI